MTFWCWISQPAIKNGAAAKPAAKASAKDDDDSDDEEDSDEESEEETKVRFSYISFVSRIAQYWLRSFEYDIMC